MIFKFVLITLLVGIVMVSGCVQNDTPSGDVPASPLLVDLTVDEFPGDRTLDVILMIGKNVGYPSGNFNAIGLEAEIILPEGLELVEGNPMWQGDLIGDETAEIRIKVEAIQNGEWRIEGKTNRISMPPYDQLLGTDYAYVLIEDDDIRISDSPFTLVNPSGQAEQS